jgi:hypothetical protein
MACCCSHGGYATATGMQEKYGVTAVACHVPSYACTPAVAHSTCTAGPAALLLPASRVWTSTRRAVDVKHMPSQQIAAQANALNRRATAPPPGLATAQADRLPSCHAFIQTRTLLVPLLLQVCKCRLLPQQPYPSLHNLELLGASVCVTQYGCANTQRIHACPPAHTLCKNPTLLSPSMHQA